MATTYLAGHSDIIVNSQKMSWMEEISAWTGDNEVSELRVSGWNNPPFIQARQAHQDAWGQEYIHVWGPMYSLIREAVKKINYT